MKELTEVIAELLKEAETAKEKDAKLRECALKLFEMLNDTLSDLPWDVKLWETEKNGHVEEYRLSGNFYEYGFDSRHVVCLYKNIRNKDEKSEDGYRIALDSVTEIKYRSGAFIHRLVTEIINKLPGITEQLKKMNNITDEIAERIEKMERIYLAAEEEEGEGETV